MANRKSKYDKRLNLSAKTKLVFDIAVLDLFCVFILSKNKTIKKTNYIQMRNLFTQLDREPYLQDPAKLSRIDFILKGLEARLDKRLTDQNMILMYAKGGILQETDVIDLEKFTDIPTPEVDYVNETVSICLKHLHFQKIKDDVKDILNEYESTDYKDRDPVLKKFEKKIQETNNYFRRVKNNNNEASYFCLQPEVMQREIEETYNALANPSAKLKTGMQGFNELLGGGVELGKHYMVFGLPGEGKSASALNIAYQIKKYNPDYQTKDPTKRPCIVYESQENSKKETIERFYNITTNSKDFITDSPDKIFEDMQNEGKLVLTDDNPIDIIIMYREPFTNDTSSIEEVIDNLYDEGYEVILYIHDYVQKIHCQDRTKQGDSRLELGAVVSEEVAIAKSRDIAFWTMGQLNRDASSKIDTGKSTNKVDLVRMLGRSNIGECMLMLNHTDGAFIIAPEFNVNESRWYYGIQRIKKRFKASDRTYIYQPAAPDCKIKLMEDLGKQPMFRDSMRPDQNTHTVGVSGGTQIAMPQIQKTKIVNLDADGGFIPMETTDSIMAARMPNTAALITISPVMIKREIPKIKAPFSYKTPAPFSYKF